MFRRILIANRGEVAHRILRTCRALGIESVVVASTADAGAPYLEAADEVVVIGGPRPDQSYLQAARIVQAARQTNCQAIHPGFGFLAENAAFAAMCEAAGVTFIGPPAAVMQEMGEKARAKAAVAAAGLPLIPGSDGLLADLDEARTVAARVGYPVLVKADAGGGGRGMRIAQGPDDLARAWNEAAAEAAAAFGNPALYLERYIPSGRHIEFQVLADRYGNAVHLGERECSVQRRHQKLLEEAPSTIGAALRAEMGARVARAAEALGYEGVGTVEFLLSPEGELYFMEMNTRLQVEHPVTEELTGVDLVEAQIRVAAGERLWLKQEDITLTGHAIECRINAEDPDQGFAPRAGTIQDVVLPEPVEGARIRFDSHVAPGYPIPPWYDSMIAKLIVYGPDRESARVAAIAALEGLQLPGVVTTASFHQQVLACAPFIEASYDTGLVDRLLSEDR